MEDRAVAFLRRLLNAPGPSGYESAPAQVWREEASTFADEVTHDVVGSSFARIKPSRDATDAPKVLLAGHIDEIGFVITHIDKEGFLWFSPLGGWDDQVVVGQRLRIAARNGDVIGVIGKKAAHLLKEEDRRKPTRLDEMWIDIGARDHDDATRKVAVGDAAVIDSRFIELSDDICVARSMDNRVGAFVALEAARLAAADRGAADVYAVATAQEEITFGGAYTASFSVAPMVAIAIDVTHALTIRARTRSGTTRSSWAAVRFWVAGQPSTTACSTVCGKPPAPWESRPPCKRPGSQAVPMPTP